MVESIDPGNFGSGGYAQVPAHLGIGRRVMIGDREYEVVSEDDDTLVLDAVWEEPPPRTGAFIAVMLMLLLVMGGILWALADVLNV